MPDGKRHCAIVLTTDSDLQRSGCFRRFGGLLLRKGLTVRVFLSFLTTHAFATVWAFYVCCFHTCDQLLQPPLDISSLITTPITTSKSCIDTCKYWYTGKRS